jgi:predicted Fe-S protein YdhL (DUF1289 family)
MTVRRLTILLVAVAAIALMFALPSIALAFDSVHGGTTMNTDACAGCHRAHTAASPITWTDADNEEQSALLISTATTIEDFCYTCHGTAALGADTNVWDGIFESDDGDLGSDEVFNGHGEALNGGGFDPTVFPTQHYGSSGVSWVAYGGGDDGREAGSIISVGGEHVDISCAACHDTHGSSNYRLLKDLVVGSLPTGGTGGVNVGGYIGDVPNPFVISAELGYPTGGWPLGEERMAAYTTYYPDFTDPMYAKAPGGDVNKGISGWCASCHTQYNTAGTNGMYASFVYDAADGFGLVTRHRHPVNVALSEFRGPRDLVVATNPLPLGHSGNADAGVQELSDWVDCLTCHVAHGSSAKMTGYAAVADVTNIEPDSSYRDVPGDGYGSVPPGDGNGLLRGDNRYVCQACHNK